MQSRGIVMEEIYQKYAQTVYKYLLSKIRNADLAEELTQETFYQAVRSIERFDGSCKISTWLCAIAKNQLLAYYGSILRRKILIRSRDYRARVPKQSFWIRRIVWN